MNRQEKWLKEQEQLKIVLDLKALAPFHYSELADFGYKLG